MINLFQPKVDDDELRAIRDVFSSNWLGPGDRVKEFESAFAGYLGRPPPEVLAVTSCTEALFQTVASLGLSDADEVIVPTISFIGAAHAVKSSGARVALCDVDPQTLNPTVEEVERVITPASRAILILHYGGAPGAVAEIAEMAERKSLLLIEDAAVSLGSLAGDRPCGTLGDIGVWSFDAMKVVTTGDGGMIWCRDAVLADQIRMNIRLGVGPSGFDRRIHSQTWWEVDPPAVGRRATMNDVAASIGLVQLGKLGEFLQRRNEIAAAYDAALARIEWVRRPWHPPQAARTFYWIQTPTELRDRLALHLLDRGIYTNFQYWPLHRTRMYLSDDPFPGGDEAADRTLLLPLHQGLSDDDVERVLEGIRSFGRGL